MRFATADKKGGRHYDATGSPEKKWLSKPIVEGPAHETSISGSTAQRPLHAIRVGESNGSTRWRTFQKISVAPEAGQVFGIVKAKFKSSIKDSFVPLGALFIASRIAGRPRPLGAAEFERSAVHVDADFVRPMPSQREASGTTICSGQVTEIQHGNAGQMSSEASLPPDAIRHSRP
ncbi:hypothetical protein [Paraburkholderia strydomiana]